MSRAGRPRVSWRAFARPRLGVAAPDAGEVEGTQGITDLPLALIVNISAITAPEDALIAFGGTSKEQSVCHLVLLTVTRELLGT
jgi:hypothetical protein